MRKDHCKRKKKESWDLRGRYFFCITGLLLVIAVAFWLPQAVFAAQNYYQGSRLVSGMADEQVFASFDTNYEYDVKTRLEEFARGVAEGRQYYALASDCELSEEELHQIVMEIHEQDWTGYTYTATNGVLDLYYDFVLDDCRRYVIYDGNFESGIALSCLYLEMSLQDDSQKNVYPKVRVLIDMEDGTIYAAEISADSASISNRQKIAKQALLDYLYYFIRNMVDKDAIAHSYEQYYQASDYRVSYSDDGTAAESYSEVRSDAIRNRRGENYYDLFLPIFFEEESLQMWFSTRLEDDETLCSGVGIEEIRQLIPEFAED